MPKSLTVLILLCASLLAGGCSTAYSTHPIGDAAVDIESQRDAWAGTWSNGEASLTVQVVDGAKGILRIGWIEDKDDTLKLMTGEVFLRSAGDWMFASMRPAEKPDEARYVWARIKRSGRTVTVWFPDVKKLRALVQAGKVRGELAEKDITFPPLDTRELAEMASEKNGVLFEWETPLVLHRQ